MSEIEGALLEYDSSYDTVYRAFFMLNGKDLEMRELIRSTIFRINVFGGENTKQQSVSVDVKPDYKISFNDHLDNIPRSYLYCLAKLENSIWKCKYKHQINNTSKILTYQIFEDGIYAVIFYPSMPLEDIIGREVFCGIMCSHRRLFFVIIMLVIPSVCGIIVFLYIVYEQKLEQDNLMMKTTFLDLKMKEIEDTNVDFKGQTIFEKIEEGVQYFVNPVRNEGDSNL